MTAKPTQVATRKRIINISSRLVLKQYAWSDTTTSKYAQLLQPTKWKDVIVEDHRQWISLVTLYKYTKNCAAWAEKWHSLWPNLRNPRPKRQASQPELSIELDTSGAVVTVAVMTTMATGIDSSAPVYAGWAENCAELFSFSTFCSKKAHSSSLPPPSLSN